MKRYAMGFWKGGPAMFEQPEGEYVKWADVQALEQRVAELEAALRRLQCDVGVSVEAHDIIAKVIGTPQRPVGVPACGNTPYDEGPFTLAERRPLGCALAMRVMQSDLYQQLDEAERADCDELVRQNLEWFKADSAHGVAEAQAPNALAVAEALHEAVAVIYLTDSSDYLPALWTIVRHLAPGIAELLEKHPSAAYHTTDAARDRLRNAGVAAADERQQFEAAMGEALKTDQGAYALSRAHLPDQPYTFLATKWAWSAWQRARGVSASDGKGFGAKTPIPSPMDYEGEG